MVECEICMDKFPIDCFEFLPCAHKLCQFCYHNIKQLKCPYCRLDLEPKSDIEDTDYDPEYDIPPKLHITNRNRRRRNRRNRRNAQRNSNNQMFYDLSNINTSLESNERNTSNASNERYRTNRNNLRNTTERFTISTVNTISTISTTSTTSTSLNNNHFSLLAD